MYNRSKKGTVNYDKFSFEDRMAVKIQNAWRKYKTSKIVKNIFMIKTPKVNTIIDLGKNNNKKAWASCDSSHITNLVP